MLQNGDVHRKFINPLLFKNEHLTEVYKRIINIFMNLKKIIKLNSDSHRLAQTFVESWMQF